VILKVPDFLVAEMGWEPALSMLEQARQSLTEETGREHGITRDELRCCYLIAPLSNYPILDSPCSS
jgi:hypothetical protein